MKQYSLFKKILRETEQKSTASLMQFQNFSVNKLLEEYQSHHGHDWSKKGEQNALKLFHTMANEVPAYKDFLKKQNISPDVIKTIKDFREKVPVLTKENYINVYPLHMLLKGGKLEHAELIAASSGTTGAPHLWPRSQTQEIEAAIVHELLFSSVFQASKCKTLAIIGFPLGVYISGVATTLPLHLLSFKNPHFTFATPGLNKDSILDLIERSITSYDQILLIGHPFFLKDVIETGKARNIDWTSISVRMMMCSEGFTEEWRDYLLNFLQRDALPSAIINTYGSSEFLLIGNETPLSIALRREASMNQLLHENLFPGIGTTPQLFQYNPALRYIEEIDTTLLFTVNSGIPLVRFSLGDRGKLHAYEDISAHAHSVAPHFAKQYFSKKNKNWQLPFIVLVGRCDYALLFHGINIYPEYFHKTLNSPRFLPFVTGKFTIEKKYTARMDPFLELNVEMQKNVILEKTLSSDIADSVYQTLLESSIEFSFLVKSITQNLRPKVVLWDYQSEKYFKVGVKPKYIIRPSQHHD